MYILSEALVKALEGFRPYIPGGYDISGVKVICDPASCEYVIKDFMEDFTSRWKLLMEETENKYGNCYDAYRGGESYIPVSVKKTDYGFFISCRELEIRYCWGDYYEEGMDIEDVLKPLKKKYPGIEYEGYIGYLLGDVRCGQVVEDEISSKRLNRKEYRVYDFIGTELNHILEDDDYGADFWGGLGEHLYEPEDYRDTLKTLYAYSQFIGKTKLSKACNKIIEMADPEHGSLYADLNELVKKLEAGEETKFAEAKALPDPIDDEDSTITDMILLAWKLGAPKLEGRNVIFSPEDYIDFVIEKAESGDIDAKLASGKYFIENHIDAEKDRAVRWIKDASDSGLEEASNYMNKRKDLFSD